MFTKPLQKESICRNRNKMQNQKQKKIVKIYNSSIKGDSGSWNPVEPGLSYILYFNEFYLTPNKAGASKKGLGKFSSTRSPILSSLNN